MIADRSILMILVALAGCPGTTPDPMDDRGDTLVIGLAADPANLLSVVQSSVVDQGIANNLLYGALEEDFDCKLKHRPRFVREWSWSDDGLTLSMTLRDDIRWQDGAPVTAEDVAFAYELIGDPAVASPVAGVLARLKPNARPRVLSPTKLAWTFTSVYDRDTMISDATSILPVPRHLLQTADRGSLRAHPLNATLPTSNGPWKIASWERQKELVLEPNEAFTGPAEERPRLDRVRFRIIPDYADRVRALLAGTVDLVDRMTVADADAVERSDTDIRLRRRGWRNMDYVAWNQLDSAGGGKPNRLFADREVRRALASAIDTDRLIRELLTSQVTGEVYGRPAIGTLTPALCGVHNDAIRRIPFDPAAARARLGELGWADTNGDGWLDKDGEPFRFTMISNADSTLRGDASKFIKLDLEAVGVEVQLEELAGEAFVAKLRDRAFDAALAGWSAALFADPSSTWGAGAPFNLTGYANPEAQRIIDHGLAAADPGTARQDWLDLQRVIYEDQPYAFLYWSDEIVAISSRFQDASIDVISPWRNLNRWHVSPAKVKYKE